MGTTARGLPFPEDTGFVVDGAGAIEALAVEVNAELDGVDAARAAGDNALDGRLDTLEARQHVSALVDAAGDLLVGAAPDTLARLPRGSALDALRVNTAGTGLEWAASAGGVEVNVFTASGIWTKPEGAKLVVVDLISGGGAGYSGYNSSAAGGGGGGAAVLTYDAADLPATVSVTVGAGGLTNTAQGTPSGDGGTSSFAGASVLGGKGASGVGSGKGGGNEGTTNTATKQDWAGGAGGQGSNTSTTYGGGDSLRGAGGGGGSRNGGSPAGAGGSSGTAGDGGAGGYYNGPAAGDGQIPGGGGGGHYGPGAGGDGARGEVRVTTYF